MSPIHSTGRRVVLGLASLVCLLLAGSAWADTLTYTDPEGDDNGPGGYTYPTDSAYQRGDFDMTGVEIEYDDETVEFRVEVARRIEDPWHSPEWNGNGFSVQFAQVYIDFDRADTAGHTRGLPGINVQFPADQAWNKVVLISPQPASRVQAEISEKAGDMAADAIVPDRTWSRGNTLYARVPRSAFGSSDPAHWGVQVVLQSNEGYPTANDILTRAVNEFEGPHRFGGGNDLYCDPHVMDILAGQGQGAADEADLQHQALSTFLCDGSEEGTWATIPLVYR
jgi:carbohydrate-binding DOMON domain-containing protein